MAYRVVTNQHMVSGIMQQSIVLFASPGQGNWTFVGIDAVFCQN